MELGAAATDRTAATISLADGPGSAFASAAGGGNAALKFASTLVTFDGVALDGMALKASATLAFGGATLGPDTAN